MHQTDMAVVVQDGVAAELHGSGESKQQDSSVASPDDTMDSKTTFSGDAGR